MSATEIIREIQKLPAAEQEKVVAYVRQLEANERGRTTAGGVSEEFKHIADEVFTTNAELFRKLAK